MRCRASLTHPFKMEHPDEAEGEQTCVVCKGKGIYYEEECLMCNGTGRMKKE